MRQLSIDFVRGGTIALMMVVNNPGTWSAVYPPLLHAEWHGCTLTDLVFPFFLYVVGASMWFSLEKYHNTGLTRALLLKIAKRSALLILAGLLLAKFPFYWKNWDTWRFPGVLQRIGLCYGIAAVLVLTCSLRTLIAVSAALLLGYWAALYFWNPADPYSLETNLVRHIDLSWLGAQHIWKGKGVPFDPEGLLSTLPAVVTVLLGWWSGRVIGKAGQQLTQAVQTLTLTAVALYGVAACWNLAFPINKYLWTSSYVLHTGALAMVFLAVAVWVLDIQKWRGWWADFFLIYGSNPLFAYILAGVVVKTMINIKWEDPSQKSGTTHVYQWLYTHTWGAISEGKMGSMLFSITFCLLIWLVCLYLYRKHVFIKI